MEEEKNVGIKICIRIKNSESLVMSEFQGSHCYRLQAIETPWSSDQSRHGKHSTNVKPLLPCIDAVIILTMDSPTGLSRRRTLMKKYGGIIRTLCPRAFFQVNRGFIACPKDHVYSPPDDIVHAILHAFRSTEELNNILLMEDDAMFESSGDNLRISFQRVNNFIQYKQIHGEPLNTYNLGAIAHGLIPCGTGLHHRKIVGFMGAAQAVIWSRPARKSFIKSVDLSAYPPGEMPMADDRTLVPQLNKHAFTYKRPIVTQIFPKTENSDNWKFFRVPHKKKSWKSGMNSIAQKSARGLLSFSRLDKNTQPGWNIVYGYGSGLTVFTSFISALMVMGGCALMRSTQ